MKYTLEQRLDIGRRIYEGELTRFQAAEEYGINDNTARNYMWLYRDTNHLPPKNAGRKRKKDASKTPQPIDHIIYLIIIIRHIRVWISKLQNIIPFPIICCYNIYPCFL